MRIVNDLMMLKVIAEILSNFLYTVPFCYLSAKRSEITHKHLPIHHETISKPKKIL